MDALTTTNETEVQVQMGDNEKNFNDNPEVTKGKKVWKSLPLRERMAELTSRLPDSCQSSIGKNCETYIFMSQQDLNDWQNQIRQDVVRKIKTDRERKKVLKKKILRNKMKKILDIDINNPSIDKKTLSYTIRIIKMQLTNFEKNNECYGPTINEIITTKNFLDACIEKYLDENK